MELYTNFSKLGEHIKFDELNRCYFEHVLFEGHVIHECTLVQLLVARFFLLEKGLVT